MNSFRTALGELLSADASHIPELTTEELEQGGFHRPQQKLFLDDGCFWIISLGEAHYVELTVIRLDAEIKKIAPEYPIDPEDGGLTAEVSVKGLVSDPVSWTLGAACAIALAREGNSMVTDSGRYWTGTYQQSADAFLAEVKEGKANDLRKAAATVLQSDI